MKNIQAITDKTAISLSVLCTIHCLALPILIVMLPTLGALNLQDEVFHQAMLVFVVPISIYALTMGCKQHDRRSVIWAGSIGLIILVAGAFLGHDLGEIVEKTLTVIGAAIIAMAHFFNHRLCKASDCECQA